MINNKNKCKIFKYLELLFNYFDTLKHLTDIIIIIILIMIIIIMKRILSKQDRKSVEFLLIQSKLVHKIEIVLIEK